MLPVSKNLRIVIEENDINIVVLEKRVPPRLLTRGPNKGNLSEEYWKPIEWFTCIRAALGSALKKEQNIALQYGELYLRLQELEVAILALPELALRHLEEFNEQSNT